nr:NADH dehydrogenase subunit 6 [Nionia sp.]
MKILIMKMMIVVTSMIPFLKTPMSMGVMLLVQAMLTSLFLSTILSSSWIPMITFLMMIGGLLILFTYMSSIASNEKFNMKINISMLMIILLIFLDTFMFEFQIQENQDMKFMLIKDLSMIKLYNKKSMILTMILLLFLLLTMISVSKMVKHHEGPLRQKN